MYISLYSEEKFLSNKFKKHYFFVIECILNSDNSSFKIISDINNCDYTIFPLDIIYAVKEFGLHEIEIFLKKSAKAGKKTWIFSRGDFGLSLLDSKYDIIHFRLGGFKSKFKTKTEIIPPFIKDPYNSESEFSAIDNDSISVGFVGHANGSIIKILKELLLHIFKFVKNIFGSEKNDFQNFYPSSIRRYHWLKKLKKIKNLNTNFILRKKYRAGVSKNKNKRKTTEKEFFHNIKSNIFTFCMRGGGNYSVRFYETLACGRIPLYIDTDAKLPLDNIIEWKDYIIIIETKDDIIKIQEKIKKFLAKNDLRKMQIANRKLWLSHLNKKNYLKQIYEIYKKKN